MWVLLGVLHLTFSQALVRAPGRHFLAESHPFWALADRSSELGREEQTETTRRQAKQASKQSVPSVPICLQVAGRSPGPSKTKARKAPPAPRSASASAPQPSSLVVAGPPRPIRRVARPRDWSGTDLKRWRVLRSPKRHSRPEALSGPASPFQLCQKQVPIQSIGDVTGAEPNVNKPFGSAPLPRLLRSPRGRRRMGDPAMLRQHARVRELGSFVSLLLGS